MLETSAGHRLLLLAVMLFIPLGLVMDFVHESGHAIWGTAMGGRLTYMQITYLEIFPRLAIAQNFQLGITGIENLAYGSASYGIMLLGGSGTTNFASWMLGFILLKTRVDKKTQVTLRILGLFGILDLPSYVIFPQIGLSHWIFLGGREPEPSLGARMIGMPDPAFYILVALSTLGLTILYSKSIRSWLTLFKKNVSASSQTVLRNRHADLVYAMILRSKKRSRSGMASLKKPNSHICPKGDFETK